MDRGKGTAEGRVAREDPASLLDAAQPVPASQGVETMDAPVRVVCGGCLRSVELSQAPGESHNRCPHCGGVLDSQADGSVIDTKVANPLDGVRAAELNPPDSSEDWTENWTRGSLGMLGRFQLRERLGDGGFGQVFLAFDPRLDRDVALKVLKEPNPSERVMERFFREARAAARLDHPNIVAVYDAGFDSGRCWVAFQYVSGRPLTWYRDHHRLDPPTCARIMRELADAVDHGHHQGVLHRDIKPANVIIDDHGRPRLIDFGLARRADLDSSLTRDGAVVGTPAYMSPEQAHGFSREVDERSDVFSLGVIFFEVLCGRKPYHSESIQTPDAGPPQPATPRLVPDGAAKPAAVPSVRAINPLVPAALDRICIRAIAQNPDDRYPSARALADELDRWLLQHRGDKVRLSFAISTIILGVAAALLLVIAIRSSLMPWNDGHPGSVPPLAATTGDGEATPSKAIAAKQTLAAPLGELAPHDRLIGNVGKSVYHRADCKDVAAMNPHNRITLSGPQEAAAKGLRPCGHCTPPTLESHSGTTSPP
jgi:serine/threonine protein kinase